MRILSDGISASEQSIRVTSWGLLISSEKIAISRSGCFIPTFAAMFKANALLPIPGLAATRMRSVLFSPDSIKSSWVNPDASPVIRLSSRWFIS